MATPVAGASLADLTRRRWALAVLARLAAGVPARVAPLAVALGASRGGIAEALAALSNLGLLQPVPPPRHPLQSELVLTELGAAWAAAALRLDAAGAAIGVAAELRQRWSLPIIAALPEPCRFGALRRALPLASDRALALALANLVEARLIGRRVVVAAHPPASLYALLPRAAPIARELAAMA